MDKKLEQYLVDIVVLERRKMIAGRTYNQLLVNENECNSQLSFQAKKIKLNINWIKVFLMCLIGIPMICGVLATITVGDEFINNHISSYMFIVLLIEIGYIVWTITSRKIKQQNKYEEDKRRVEEIKRQGKSRLVVIQREKPKLRNCYAQCEKVLEQLYSLGIVHSKYCYYEACAMFLDYLNTGRTHSLEATFGDPGAYNLFEEELRFNKIVNKLDQVLQSQRFLYHELQEINSNVSALCNSMNEVKQYSKETMKNTRTAAFYSSVTAYNTSVIRKISENYYRFG